jgi:hypothetical protein
MQNCGLSIVAPHFLSKALTRLISCDILTYVGKILFLNLDKLGGVTKCQKSMFTFLVKATEECATF